MKKRLLSLAMAMVMVMTFIPMVGMAAGAAEPRNGFYEVVDGILGYYKNGEIDMSVTDVKYDPVSGNWYNVENGFVIDGPTVAHNAAGWWYIDRSGKVDFRYNGFSWNEAGWWYCKNGKVDFKTTGVVFDQFSGDWVFVRNNQLAEGPDVQPNAAGWWYIDEGGYVDFYYYGVAHNAAGWWRIEGGKVNFNFNGIASNDAGSWYLQGGKVDFSKNGRVRYNGRTYYVRGGKVV